MSALRNSSAARTSSRADAPGAGADASSRRGYGARRPNPAEGPPVRADPIILFDDYPRGWRAAIMKAFE
jgi:hypothetical protein